MGLLYPRDVPNSDFDWITKNCTWLHLDAQMDNYKDYSIEITLNLNVDINL